MSLLGTPKSGVRREKVQQSRACALRRGGKRPIVALLACLRLPRHAQRLSLARTRAQSGHRNLRNGIDDSSSASGGVHGRAHGIEHGSHAMVQPSAVESRTRRIKRLHSASARAITRNLQSCAVSIGRTGEPLLLPAPRTAQRTRRRVDLGRSAHRGSLLEQGSANSADASSERRLDPCDQLNAFGTVR